jgi:hypothetical protein
VTLQRQYPRALLAFRGGNLEAAQAFAAEAWSWNDHVAAIITRRKPAASVNPSCVVSGGRDEATLYVAALGFSWRETPDAIPWLTRVSAALPVKPRLRR